MPSPFPGMDPYLERHWGDVHHRFITYACDQLQDRLPKGLRARVEERVSLQSLEGGIGIRVPDLRVIAQPRSAKSSRMTSGGLAVAAALFVPLNEPVTEGYIQILDTESGNKIITVIEVLSRTCKLPGDGRAEYLKKRKELRAGHVSLVEIDLLRSGERILPFHPDQLPSGYLTPYLVLVHRGEDIFRVEFYPIPLREHLPVIGVPLRDADDDAALDLQAIIDQCYRNGAYGDDLDYEAEPIPPLDPEDAEWADALLGEHGKRKRRHPPQGPNRRGRRRKR